MRSRIVWPLRLAILSVVIFVTSDFDPAYAGKKGAQLTAEEVRELVIGNTEKGQFNGTPYRTYFAEDGKLRETSSLMPEGINGKWEIKDDGCLHLDFAPSTKYDGCYYYYHHEPEKGKYKVHEPWKGGRSTVTILKGNQT